MENQKESVVGRKALADRTKGMSCTYTVSIRINSDNTEFKKISDEEKLTAVMRAGLFCRTEPSHKSQLVDLLQSQGLVVAMVRQRTCHMQIIR